MKLQINSKLFEKCVTNYVSGEVINIFLTKYTLFLQHSHSFFNPKSW